MLDTRFDIVGLGNAIVDVICPVEDAFLTEWGIRKDGMTLIDEARAKILSGAAEGQYLSGGSGANTIAGVASLGGRAAYFGKVADDALGAVFHKETTGGGVHFNTAALVGGPATAQSIIFVTPDGARSMNTFLGATVMFSSEDVDADVVRAGAILYLEGYLFDRDAAKGAFVHAAEIAAAAGRKTALTLSDSFCVDRHRESFRHLIRGHIDILFANEAELLSLYETNDFGEAIAQLRHDAPLAAVTRGAKGSILIGEGDPIDVPAEPIDRVVDTTGAGDQYAAGVLFGLSRGMAFPTAAKLGHIAAAEVISHYGPRPETALTTLARANGYDI